jgi:hypothetical protein
MTPAFRERRTPNARRGWIGIGQDRSVDRRGHWAAGANAKRRRVHAPRDASPKNKRLKSWGRMQSSPPPAKGKGMFWSSDWAWGMPLLVLTVVFHVCVFVLIVKALVLKVHSERNARNLVHFFVAIALTALAAAALHGLEATAWAILYVRVGAMSDLSTSILYSLSAITSYGHSEVFLEDRWKLLGAIEAMNGLILFGLTTAFLFAAIEEVRPVRRR